MKEGCTSLSTSMGRGAKTGLQGRQPPLLYFLFKCPLLASSLKVATPENSVQQLFKSQAKKTKYFMTTVSVGFNKLLQMRNVGLSESNGAFAIVMILYGKLQVEEERDIYTLVIFF